MITSFFGRRLIVVGLLGHSAFGPLCVVERLVELSRDPQAVQEHREFASHGHRRSFLGVLAAAICL
jgi:hypothetical protein